MRDNAWLAQKLNELWANYFPDVERRNNVFIRFKGRWKNKFGHIKQLKTKDTEVCVNGLFSNESVPEYIIDLTIAHEVVHYSHGFQSPHEKRFEYPHQGGIVRKELIARGFKTQLKDERKWVKNEWLKSYRTFCPSKAMPKRNVTSLLGYLRRL